MTGHLESPVLSMPWPQGVSAISSVPKLHGFLQLAALRQMGGMCSTRMRRIRSRRCLQRSDLCQMIWPLRIVGFIVLLHCVRVEKAHHGISKHFVISFPLSNMKLWRMKRMMRIYQTSWDPFQKISSNLITLWGGQSRYSVMRRGTTSRKVRRRSRTGSIKVFGDEAWYHFEESEKKKSHRVIGVRSNVWPGACAVTQGGETANIYIGYGLKCGSLVPRSPKSGLSLKSTFP